MEDDSNCLFVNKCQIMRDMNFYYLAHIPTLFNAEKDLIDKRF